MESSCHESRLQGRNLKKNFINSFIYVQLNVLCDATQFILQYVKHIIALNMLPAVEPNQIELRHLFSLNQIHIPITFIKIIYNVVLLSDNPTHNWKTHLS